MIPKFRAYIKEKNEIWEVARIDYISSYVLVVPIGGESTDITRYDFSEIELLPFTGLTDKNGNEIYKGHIIDGFIVDYASDLEACLGMNSGWYLQRDNFESYVELKCSEEHEIQGDIYTTPELLKN